MKVLLIDADNSSFPNLALMKLSAHHKRKGDEVEFRKVTRHSIGLPHPNPDKVYVSCIFSRNKQKAIKIPKMFPNSKVLVGGYGVNDEGLPHEIEHCFDNKTEILTRTGWKPFSQLTNEDEVATLRSDDLIEYQRPIHIFCHDYDGGMILCESKHVNFCVTPYHRLYVRRFDSKGWDTGFKLLKAEKIKSNIQFKKTGKWKGREQQLFVLPSVNVGHHLGQESKPAKPIPMELWLEFFGYFLSEGTAYFDVNSGSYTVKIYQSRSSKFRSKIEECIKKLAFNCHVGKREISIKDKQLHSYLAQFGEHNEKFVPLELKELSPRQLWILLESIAVGDGTFEAGSFRIFTTSKRLADDIQEIALKTGYACNIRVRKKLTEGEHKYYQIRILRKFLNPRIANCGKHVVVRRARYKGKVWCCEVPNGLIYVRRNGIPLWSGNSMPDYSLYNMDYSIGFTSRGCIRKCPWCIVPEKEGMIRDNAPITEFLHEDHHKVVLLDNNLLAAPRWKETLQFLIDHDIKVSFNQGLDIRLVNEENAAMLADVNYWNLHFTRRFLYFAFDLPSMEKEVRQGIRILNNAGIKSTYIRVYMLTNFNTTFEEDRHRFEVLRELGVEPFVMLYDKEHASEKKRDFQRYGTRPAIWRKVPWEEYDRLLTFRRWREKKKLEPASSIYFLND